MCKVSDKIKFCTCGSADIFKLKHYWILHRFVKGKNLFIVGDFMIPFDIDEDLDNCNVATLTQRLNEPDAFDIDISPREKDILQIVFTVPRYNQKITYYFIFKTGNWQETNTEPLLIQEHHDLERTGKLENALDKNYKGDCRGNKMRY